MKSVRWATAVLVATSFWSAMAAWGFSSYEHKEIGDTGFAAAVRAFEKAIGKKALEGIPRIRVGEGPWALMKENIYAGSGKGHGNEVGWFSFGDLVALYGDYRGDFNHLNNAATKARAAALRETVRTGKVASAETSVMLELAQVNATHFSKIAVRTYLKYHGKALKLAADKAQLWKALHYEALALHSYTDAFAVGHMFGSREDTMRMLAQIDTEAKRDAQAKSTGLWSKMKKMARKLKRAVKAQYAKKWLGFMTNISHNGFNHFGATVRNFAGDQWKAYGDQRYRRCATEPRSAEAKLNRDCGGSRELDTQKQRQVIRKAVKTSILQVLLTAHGRQPARGQRFAALRFLPVKYRDAMTTKSLWKQKFAVLKAVVKRNVHIIADAGLKASLLEGAKVPDGTVNYLKLVRRRCGQACGGAVGAWAPQVKTASVVQGVAAKPKKKGYFSRFKSWFKRKKKKAKSWF